MTNLIISPCKIQILNNNHDILTWLEMRLRSFEDEMDINIIPIWLTHRLVTIMDRGIKKNNKGK
jgi:hypothetical protein